MEKSRHYKKSANTRTLKSDALAVAKQRFLKNVLDENHMWQGMSRTAKNIILTTFWRIWGAQKSSKIMFFWKYENIHLDMLFTTFAPHWRCQNVTKIWSKIPRFPKQTCQEKTIPKKTKNAKMLKCQIIQNAKMSFSLK